MKHIMLALQANVIMKIGDDYIVSGGEIKLLDSTTGRIMEGLTIRIRITSSNRS
ncbi:hypothetical protein [Weissella koreensis]|uniref:preprotein translocase subunit SecA n=1 Tax=Weissella koreensis TaxID=165096 RepID=UPI002F40403A